MENLFLLLLVITTIKSITKNIIQPNDLTNKSNNIIFISPVRCVETGNLQFIPGIIAGEEEDEENPFIAGQFIQVGVRTITLKHLF